MSSPLLPVLPGYADLELIAHGTSALVFRATQTRLNRPVAIKVITVDTGAGTVPVNAERELATTVALSSQPHIVSIIDTGVTDDDRPYIVMEYCEGGSYSQILRQHGPLPVEDVLEVGIKIGEALHAAHQVGIVHRDVKPSNILRSRFGPALTDFGIARAPDELGGTLTREMMTPHHASPEALLHQAQSGLSDVYSLASTMWTLLVGHPPFVDPAQPEIDMYTFRDRVLHDPLPAMPRSDVPAWLLGELRKAMAKLPSQRHGSALEFAESLRRGSLGLEPSAAASADPPSRPTTSSPTGRAQVHLPGMPAQAWPLTETPAAPPPVETPALSTLDGPHSPRLYGGPAAAPPPAPAGTATPAPPEVAPSQPPPPPVSAPPVGAPHSYEDGPLYRPTAAARPAQPSHPLAAGRPPAPPVIDEGGWLGPQPDQISSAWPEPPPEPTPPRPFTQREVTAPSGGRRGGLMAVVVGVSLIAAATAVLLILNSQREPAAQPGPSNSADLPSVTVSPSLITAGTEGAPTDLRIENDTGATVMLVWTDPTGGDQSYVAVQLATETEEPKHVTVAPGGEERTVTFSGLDPEQDYCFTVGTVLAVNNVATADPVCTTR